MAKVLRCRDLGMDCPAEIRGETEEEVLEKAKEHAEKEHSKKTIPDGYKDVWRKRIENL